MRINFTVRAKNPYFWVGLLGVILTAMGVSPEMLTSWGILFAQLRELISNPFMLGSVILAVMGVICDPTTQGVNDSEQAMTYTKPRETKTK